MTNMPTAPRLVRQTAAGKLPTRRPDVALQFVRVSAQSQRRPCGSYRRRRHGTVQWNVFRPRSRTLEIRIGRYCSVVGAIFSTHRSVVIGDYVFISHEVVIADHEMAVPPV